MVTFAVQPLPEFETRQRVNKLIRDGKCMVDEFKDEVLQDNNIRDEWGELIAVVKDIANDKMLPKTRYRKLKLSKKLPYSGFEAKSHNLRLYLFREHLTGQILVCGGKKKTQEKDIARLEKIIKEYSAFRHQQIK
ncbi:MAG: hypothetical protein HYY40_11495 [Bacteroidetes bacterium]|nr:hypothetical protein [Bacteroidota bacterium]